MNRGMNSIDELNSTESVIYTTCLNCNTGCGIKVKLQEGVVVKIDGNPYSPWTLYPHLRYSTSVNDALKIDGAICPKGYAGMQIHYDPYRIRNVLKRAGKRGENKWITIPFEQAVEEIVNGGKLFSHVDGEEDRHVEGLRDVWALRDSQVMKEMSRHISLLRREKDPVKKQDLVHAFSKTFSQYMNTMIDPCHPDLGPKNNQFVFWWGRLKEGRGDLIKRFTFDSLGSINAHGHTTVCQGSLYFAGKAMSEQWGYDAAQGHMVWKDGKKFYWQAELENAEFVIFVGANVFEGNYGPPLRVRRITEGVSSGRLKYAIIDPRSTKAVSRAWKWVPVKTGKDAAIAMGMMRWIIENKRYDEKYLTNANKGAAETANQPTWSNASWLVKIADGKPTTFLRSHEIGFTPELREKDGKTYVNEKFVVLDNGKITEVDPNSNISVYGDLLVDTDLNGFRVKSVLQLLAEDAASRSLDEWAAEAGIDADVIVALAQEFTSHGKKAVVDIHRGVSQHTNGFYNVLAWNTLNLLIGNYDYKGGFIAKAEYNTKGEKTGQCFNISAHPNKIAPFGVPIIRSGVEYEESTLFTGYPAKRPWFPLASDIYQEVVPSAMDMYPYSVKTLFLYMGSPVYSLPASQAIIDTLRDIEKIPLFLAFDITVGETSTYADYIVPDLTYLERWELQGSHPSVPHKSMPVRQPAAKPYTPVVTVYGQEMPLGLESFLLGLAEKLDLPGFGPDGFSKGLPFTHGDHLYLKQIANIAMDGAPVPDADDSEVEKFMQVRKHLPLAVFDPRRWREACGEALWRKVVYVLNRGGRFEDYDAGNIEQTVKNKYGTLVNMYVEKVAQTKNSMTGDHFYGLATYIPEIQDCLGQPIHDDKAGYDLTLITGRVIQHTKSRTIVSSWLRDIEKENGIEINPQDAERLGLKNGSIVKIASVSCPDGIWHLGEIGPKELVGKIKIIEGIRPGTIHFSLGYGHFAYGSRDLVIDDMVVGGEPQRSLGVHFNVAMRIDPVLKNTGLQDLVGASICFYDTKVKLIKEVISQ